MTENDKGNYFSKTDLKSKKKKMLRNSNFNLTFTSLISKNEKLISKKKESRLNLSQEIKSHGIKV